MAKLPSVPMPDVVPSSVVVTAPVRVAARPAQRAAAKAAPPPPVVEETPEPPAEVAPAPLELSPEDAFRAKVDAALAARKKAKEPAALAAAPPVVAPISLSPAPTAQGGAAVSPEPPPAVLVTPTDVAREPRGRSGLKYASANADLFLAALARQEQEYRKRVREQAPEMPEDQLNEMAYAWKQRHMVLRGEGGAQAVLDAAAKAGGPMGISDKILSIAFPIPKTIPLPGFSGEDPEKRWQRISEGGIVQEEIVADVDIYGRATGRTAQDMPLEQFAGQLKTTEDLGTSGDVVGEMVSLSGFVNGVNSLAAETGVKSGYIAAKEKLGVSTPEEAGKERMLLQSGQRNEGLDRIAFLKESLRNDEAGAQFEGLAFNELPQAMSPTVPDVAAFKKAYSERQLEMFQTRGLEAVSSVLDPALKKSDAEILRVLRATPQGALRKFQPTVGLGLEKLDETLTTYDKAKKYAGTETSRFFGEVASSLMFTTAQTDRGVVLRPSATGQILNVMGIPYETAMEARIPLMAAAGALMPGGVVRRVATMAAGAIGQGLLAEGLSLVGADDAAQKVENALLPNKAGVDYMLASGAYDTSWMGITDYRPLRTEKSTYANRVFANYQMPEFQGLGMYQALGRTNVDPNSTLGRVAFGLDTAADLFLDVEGFYAEGLSALPQSAHTAYALSKVMPEGYRLQGAMSAGAPKTYSRVRATRKALAEGKGLREVYRAGAKASEEADVLSAVHNVVEDSIRDAINSGKNPFDGKMLSGPLKDEVFNTLKAAGVDPLVVRRKLAEVTDAVTNSLMDNVDLGLRREAVSNRGKRMLDNLRQTPEYRAHVRALDELVTRGTFTPLEKEAALAFLEAQAHSYAGRIPGTTPQDFFARTEIRTQMGPPPAAGTPPAPAPAPVVPAPAVPGTPAPVVPAPAVPGTPLVPTPAVPTPAPAAAVPGAPPPISVSPAPPAVVSATPAPRYALPDDIVELVNGGDRTVYDLTTDHGRADSALPERSVLGKNKNGKWQVLALNDADETSVASGLYDDPLDAVAEHLDQVMPREDWDTSPTRVGPVLRTMPRLAVEEAIRNAPVEYIVAFAGDGTQTFRHTTNEVDAVSFTPSELQMLRENGADTLLHNHPTMADADKKGLVNAHLSAQDVESAVASEVSVMEVTSRQGLTRMTVGTWQGLREPAFLQEFAAAYREAAEAAFKEASRSYRDVKNKRGSYDQAATAFAATYNETLTRLLADDRRAASADVVFEFQPRNGADYAGQGHAYSSAAAGEVARAVTGSEGATTIVVPDTTPAAAPSVEAVDQAAAAAAPAPRVAPAPAAAAAAPPAAPAPRVAPPAAASEARPRQETRIERLQTQIQQADAAVLAGKAKAQQVDARVKKTAADLVVAMQNLRSARDEARRVGEKMFSLKEKDATQKALSDAAFQEDAARKADASARKELADAQAQIKAAQNNASDARAQLADEKEQERLAARTPQQVVRDVLKGYEIILTPDERLVIGKVTKDADGNLFVMAIQTYDKSTLKGAQAFYETLAKDASDPDFGDGGWERLIPERVPEGSVVRPLDFDRLDKVFATKVTPATAPATVPAVAPAATVAPALFGGMRPAPKLPTSLNEKRPKFVVRGHLTPTGQRSLREVVPSFANGVDKALYLTRKGSFNTSVEAQAWLKSIGLTDEEIGPLSYQVVQYVTRTAESTAGTSFTVPDMSWRNTRASQGGLLRSSATVIQAPDIEAAAPGVTVLREAMLKAAGEETAFDPKAYAERKDICKLTGHCNAAAYVVQKKYGGELLSAKVQGETHIWNRLPNGTQVDLTGSQYGGDGFHPVVSGGKVVPLRATVNPRFKKFEAEVLKAAAEAPVVSAAPIPMKLASSVYVVLKAVEYTGLPSDIYGGLLRALDELPEVSRPGARSYIEGVVEGTMHLNDTADEIIADRILDASGLGDRVSLLEVRNYLGLDRFLGQDNIPTRALQDSLENYGRKVVESAEDSETRTLTFYGKSDAAPDAEVTFSVRDRDDGTRELVIEQAAFASARVSPTPVIGRVVRWAAEHNIDTVSVLRSGDTTERSVTAAAAYAAGSHAVDVTEGGSRFARIKLDPDMVDSYIARQGQVVLKSSSYQVPDVKPVDTYSAEFRAWFGNSAAVDETSKPQRLYHLTAQEFDTFKPGGFRPEESGRVIYLTPYPQDIPAVHQTGGDIGGRYRAGARVLPVYASIKNPLFILDADDAASAQKFKLDSFGFPRTVSDKSLAALKEAGYDGIIYAGYRDARGFDLKTGRNVEYVVFEPTQVKSAVSNTGAFSREDASILRSSSYQVPGGPLVHVLDMVNDGSFAGFVRENAEVMRALGGDFWTDEFLKNFKHTVDPTTNRVALTPEGERQFQTILEQYLTSKVSSPSLSSKMDKVFAMMQGLYLRARGIHESPTLAMMQLDAVLRPDIPVRNTMARVVSQMIYGRRTLYVKDTAAERVGAAERRAVGQRAEFARTKTTRAEASMALKIAKGSSNVNVVDVVANAIAQVTTEHARRKLPTVKLVRVTTRSIVPEERLPILRKTVRDQLVLAGINPKEIAKQVDSNTGNITFTPTQQPKILALVNQMAGTWYGDRLPRELQGRRFTGASMSVDAYNFLVELMTDTAAGPGSVRDRMAEAVPKSVGYALFRAINDGAGKNLNVYRDIKGKLLEKFHIEFDGKNHLDPGIVEIVERLKRELEEVNDWMRQAGKIAVKNTPKIWLPQIVQSIHSLLIPPFQVASLPLLIDLNKVFGAEMPYTVTDLLARLQDIEDAYAAFKPAGLDVISDLETSAFGEAHRIKQALATSGLDVSSLPPADLKVLEDVAEILVDGVQRRVQTVSDRAGEIGMALAGAPDAGIMANFDTFERKAALYSSFFEGRWDDMFDLAVQVGLTGALENFGEFQKKFSQSEALLAMIGRMRAQELMVSFSERLSMYGVGGDMAALTAEYPIGSLSGRGSFQNRVSDYIKQIVNFGEMSEVDSTGHKVYEPAPPKGGEDLAAFVKAHELMAQWGFKFGKGEWKMHVLPDGTKMLLPAMVSDNLNDAVQRQTGLAGAFRDIERARDPSKENIFDVPLTQRQQKAVEKEAKATKVRMAVGATVGGVAGASIGVPLLGAAAGALVGRDFNRALNLLVDKLPISLTHLKIGITTGIGIPNVPYYVANAFGGFMQALMGVGTQQTVRMLIQNPRFVGAVVAELFGSGKFQVSAKPIVTADGRIFTVQGVAKLAQAEGLSGSFIQAEAVRAVADDLRSMEPTFYNKMSKYPRAWQDLLMEFAGSIDNMYRVAAFVDEVRLGKSAAEAAETARKIAFDYSALTDFEKNTLRHIIMFYSYQRRNVDLFFDTLLTNPGRIAAQLRTVNHASETLLEGEAELVLPEYLRGRWILTMRDAVKESYDSGRVAVLAPQIPLMDVFTSFSNILSITEDESQKALIGKFTPWAQAPFVLGLGIEPFSGRELGSYDKIPRALYELDMPFSGGTLVRDVFGARWQANKDPSSNDSDETSGYFQATNAKTYWIWRNLFQFPLAGRSLSTLEAMDRADLGIVEGAVDLARSYREGGGSETLDAFFLKTRQGIPSILTDNSTSPALEDLNSYVPMPQDDLVAPRQGMTHMDELRSWAGVRSVRIDNPAVALDRIYREEGFELGREAKQLKRAEAFPTQR